VCLVFVRLSKINASAIFQLLIKDHCISQDFSTVQKFTKLCVRHFLSFVRSNTILDGLFVTTQWSALRLRLEETDRGAFGLRVIYRVRAFFVQAY
jgi:hypothetical protein